MTSTIGYLQIKNDQLEV